MRKRLGIALLIVVVVSAAVVVATASAADDSSTNSSAEVPSVEPAPANSVDRPGIDLSTAEDAALSGRIGLSVREDTQLSRPISEQDAVQKARLEAADVIDGAPVDVVARRVVLNEDGVSGGPVARGGLRNRPVWIVTITGVEIQRIGVNPSGVEKLTPSQLKPHTELNVVVDSETGEPMMRFHYR